MNNATKKSMVLVSAEKYDECGVDEHQCMLLELEDLKNTQFCFGDGSPETIYLSGEQIQELQSKKELVIDDKSVFEIDRFTFTVITVLVSEEGSLYVDQKDILQKGILLPKSAGNHVVRKI